MNLRRDCRIFAPARVHKVMKAIKVATVDDCRLSLQFEPVADWLLFDAKAPADRPDSFAGRYVMHARLIGNYGQSRYSPPMDAGGWHPRRKSHRCRSTERGRDDRRVSSGVEDQ